MTTTRKRRVVASPDLRLALRVAVASMPGVPVNMIADAFDLHRATVWNLTARLGLRRMGLMDALPELKAWWQAESGKHDDLAWAHAIGTAVTVALYVLSQIPEARGTFRVPTVKIAADLAPERAPIIAVQAVRELKPFLDGAHAILTSIAATKEMAHVAH
ncbi:MAG TPA: hypothetical protein VED40_23180 [Azospirillaceae bacterium]|nr:hypothetical protein [Azospirillaceae bacterium]